MAYFVLIIIFGLLVEWSNVEKVYKWTKKILILIYFENLFDLLKKLPSYSVFFLISNNLKAKLSF